MEGQVVISNKPMEGQVVIEKPTNGRPGIVKSNQPMEARKNIQPCNTVYPALNNP